MLNFKSIALAAGELLYCVLYDRQHPGITRLTTQGSDYYAQSTRVKLWVAVPLLRTVTISNRRPCLHALTGYLWCTRSSSLPSNSGRRQTAILAIQLLTIFYLAPGTTSGAIGTVCCLYAVCLVALKAAVTLSLLRKCRKDSRGIVGVFAARTEWHSRRIWLLPENMLYSKEHRVAHVQR